MIENGKWKMANGEARRRFHFPFSIFHLPLALLLLVGCSSHQPTTRPASAHDRQDAAMRDPFSYSPDMPRDDISGGDVGHYDRNAMRKDLDHVLNP
jgi:hypothetical protein